MDHVAKGIELLDTLHVEMEKRRYGVDPLEAFERIGVIIAVLKGEYDPEEDC